MKTLHVALALGLFAFSLPLVVACGDDGETTSSGSGGAASGSGGEDAGSGGDTSSPSSNSSSSGSPQGSTTSTASTASGEGGSGTGGTGGEGTGGSSPVGAFCTPRAADRDRFVVIGHPYDENAGPGTDWEVLALSSAGGLTTTGNHFEMGTAEDKLIAFSADGSIGIAVQKDYDLGVFRLDEDGTPTVIDASAFGIPDVTPDSIALAPSGDHFIVSDVNWPKNGGGLYRIDIDCETGELSGPDLVIETKNAWGLSPLGPDRWVIGGVGADGVEGGADVHVLVPGDPWTRQSGADAFSGASVVAQAIGAARDGSFVVVGNYSAASTNAVALVGTAPGGAARLGDPVEFPTPYGIAVAPAGDVAIVTSAEESLIGIFDIDPDGAEPFSFRGEVDYVVSNSQLPGAVDMITRGSLDGLVLVTELQGVRVIRFGAGGDVDNADFLVLGAEDDDFVTIPYGIGIQP